MNMMKKTFLAALAAVSFAGISAADSSAKLEAEAKKMLDAGKKADARKLYAAAGEARLKESSLYLQFLEKKGKDVELSLDDMNDSEDDILEVSEQTNIDRAVRNYVEAARDFELGAKPRKCDEALKLARGIEGASDKMKEEIDKLVKWIEKGRDPTEYDPPPYVPTKGVALAKMLKEISEIEAATKSGAVSRRSLAGRWSKLAYKAFHNFRGDIMKRALKEIKTLKMSPSHYAGMWLNGIEAYETYEKFPLDESKTKAPATLADMGVKEGITLIAGELDWDPEDATKCIQEALDTPGVTTVILEDRGQPWYVRTIRPRSNQRILFKKGVVVLQDKVSRQLKSQGDMFAIGGGVKNVILEGEGAPEDVYIGKFRTPKDRRRGCSDYGGGGVVISGARNVVVRNMTIASTACDGVTLSGLGANTRDVWLENLVLSDNYRQAMSVCNVFGLYCRNVSFMNTIGGDPMSGIDFEPTFEVEANADMYFYDCKFGGNAGSAIVFSSSSYYPVTAHFKRCYFGPVPNCYQIIIFPRCGVYMGADVKAPSRILFEECKIESHPDTYPIKLDNSVLFDVEFRNCKIEALPSRRKDNACNSPVTVNLAREYRYYFNWREYSPENNGNIMFNNVDVKGFREPFIEFRDRTGGYSVEKISGNATMNGKKIDVSKFSYKAPEHKMGLEEPRKFNPDEYFAPDPAASAPTTDIQPQDIALSWKGAWFQAPPVYRAIYADGGKWKMKLVQEGVAELGLQGKPIAFFARSLESLFKIGPRSKGKNPVFYFEVPPGGKPCTFKVVWGLGKLRNAEGEIVREFKWDGCYTTQYFTCKPKSDKGEIWSFEMQSGLTLKFFHPFSGLIAEKPEYLPRKKPVNFK